MLYQEGTGHEPSLKRLVYWMYNKLKNGNYGSGGGGTQPSQPATPATAKPIRVGTVTTLNEGTPATVTTRDTPSDTLLDFGIPKGTKGDKGNKGDAATVLVGTVTTGTAASVTNTGTQTDAILNFVLPKGQDGVGIPQTLSLSGNILTLSNGGGNVTLPTTSGTGTPTNKYEIHGTGMPNGRITAPVGTTYVDTAVTNGALKWIKRQGNGNTGWEVLTGDTGWRTLNIVSKLGSSYVKVRRKNDTVMYQFGGLQWGWFGIVRRGGAGYQQQPSDKERNVFIIGLNSIPVGFRSEFSLIGGIYNDKGTPYGTWYLGGVGDSNMLRFQFTDPVPTDKDIGDIRVSAISYLTSEQWPTTLP